jgi:hypothetical protein
MQPTQDPTPLGVTNYTTAGAGSGGTGQTGLFAPDKLQKRDKTDVVIFLHGQGQSSVRSFWTKESFKLREEMNRAGKSFLLAVPYLNNPVELGRLDTDGDGYVTDVLKKIGDPDPAPTLGNLILAAHSGGGGPMVKMAMGLSTFKSNLKEIWGMDSMYQPKILKGQDIEPLWLQFMVDCAKSNPGVKFFFNYSGDPDTSAHSNVLLRNLKSLPQGMPHLTIDISRTPQKELTDIQQKNTGIPNDHEAMVRALWFKRIDQSTNLK